MKGKGRILVNIYDFDPVEPSFKWFDISSCFQGKDKTQFAVSFKYPDEVIGKKKEFL